MQRLTNIDKWRCVEAGKAMNFENDAVRRIRLDVNAPTEVSLFYATGDGEVYFLARVVGRDVIEFATHGGTFSITVEDGDCWVYTIDGEDVSFSVPDAVVFTKLFERRARNPEVEMMAHAMRENTRRMMEQQANELERVLSRREAAFNARLDELARASAGGSGAPQPASEGADGGSGGAPADDGGSGAAGAAGSGASGKK